MLLSDVNHLWSGTGEIGSWVKPSYSDAHSPFLGGSGAQWPNENVGPTKICVGDNDPPGRVAQGDDDYYTEYDDDAGGYDDDDHRGYITTATVHVPCIHESNDSVESTRNILC